VGLSGGVLVKENHIAVAGSLKKAIEFARATAPHGLRVETEVRDLKELRQALASKVDCVMLDNFSPAEAAAALKIIRSHPVRPLVEVSGGIRLENVGGYVQPGIDVISIGSLTHSVRSVDLSLLVRSE
jgi:nicotinate-nucleotide pyrophosphorylase (carboxylating)